MSALPPLPTALPALAPLLGAAFAAGSVTQLARLLAQNGTPRARTTAALSVAAGIAAVTVVALLTALAPQGAGPALLLAAACVTGWSGPGILARLGTLIERRLGLTPTPSLFAPEPPEDAERGPS